MAQFLVCGLWYFVGLLVCFFSFLVLVSSEYIELRVKYLLCEAEMEGFFLTAINILHGETSRELAVGIYDQH